MIELSQAYDGKKILINPRFVHMVLRSGDGSVLCIYGQEDIYVRESYDQLRALLVAGPAYVYTSALVAP